MLAEPVAVETKATTFVQMERAALRMGGAELGQSIARTTLAVAKE